MPIVTFPSDTAERLKDRIQQLGKTQKIKVFAAEDIVLGLVFTTSETTEFGGDGGKAMVLAVSDMDALTTAIPEFENARRNYCIIRHERAIARLDPFA